MNELTEEVLARIAPGTDPRLREVITALIRHLHDFAREVKLTEAEWMAAVDFLTRTGQAVTPTRQEFILLSDLLGLSSLVININHPPEAGSLEASVLGPFHLPGAPAVPHGGELPGNTPGVPTLYRGRVTDTAGQPLAGAQLDIWSSDGEGTYDVQLDDPGARRGRGIATTDAEGHYAFWSVRPADYPVPTDGPPGELMRALGRDGMRPGHLHFIASAPGHESVTTQIFNRASPHLRRDAVFGVRESLVADFVEHPQGIAPDGRSMPGPFCTVDYDFCLKRA